MADLATRRPMGEFGSMLLQAIGYARDIIRIIHVGRNKLAKSLPEQKELRPKSLPQLHKRHVGNSQSVRIHDAVGLHQSTKCEPLARERRRFLAKRPTLG